MAKKNKGVPAEAITERQLRKLIRERAKEFSSLSEWAKENDITPQSISAFERKVQGPGLKIPEAVGYRPQIVFLPLECDLISTPNPPRTAHRKPTKKVDATKEPIEKRGMKKRDDRKETKKRLKKKKKGKK